MVDGGDDVISPVYGARDDDCLRRKLENRLGERKEGGQVVSLHLHMVGDWRLMGAKSPLPGYGIRDSHSCD